MVEKWRSIPKDVDVLLYRSFHETYGELCEFLKDTLYKVEANVNMNFGGWEEIKIRGEGREISLFPGSILVKTGSDIQEVDRETLLEYFEPKDKKHEGYITW